VSEFSKGRSRLKILRIADWFVHVSMIPWEVVLKDKGVQEACWSSRTTSSSHKNNKSTESGLQRIGLESWPGHAGLMLGKQNLGWN